MPDEQKTEKLMSPVEAAQFLRALADHLEKGQMEFGEVSVELDAPLKVKQTLKAKHDKITFKLKMKYDKSLLPLGGELAGGHPVLESDTDDDEAEDKAERPSFKTLKKALSSPFKQLKQALQSGQMPSLEQARAFCQQCLAITEYPGHGDEKYPAFREQVQAFLTAVEQGDLAQTQKAMAALAAQMTSCHKAYKK